MPFFDPSQITFNGDEVKDFAEVLFEKQLQNPSLESLHSIDEGIKAQKQIVIMSQLNGLLGLASGGCNPSEASNDVTLSEKFWNLATISDRLGFCYKELEPSFLNYSKKNGVDAPDITDFATFMVDKVIANALAETIYRNAWFADTNASLVSGGGNITNGTTIGYFTKFDGLWQQLFGIVTADSNRLTVGLDTRNAGANYAAQKFTPTDTTNMVVTHVLADMLTDADITLRQ
ncbi:MAG: hypothetical protein HRT87_01180, partial [Legionellales bacterium]|nr:hypothetical protein [Legionellales bacterium]